MHIANYVTGHGYGHALRSTTIANQLASSTTITFRTAVSRSFFKREMRRTYNYMPSEFDCGCLQSDGVTVDVEATLRFYTKIAERNRSLLDDEVVWCKKSGVDLIVSDITPFAFEVAAAATIPSIAVTNFTWYDIYSEYLYNYPWFRRQLDELLGQYQKASVLCALTPSLNMDYFSHIVQAPVVGRSGTASRQVLLDQYGLEERNQKIGLIYVGDFGLAEATWERLEHFKEWIFFGIQMLPGSIKNYYRVDFSKISYPDLIATADVFIGKLGYGTVAECIINRLPLIYLPRANFAEFRMLEKAVSDWGGGVSLSESAFLSLDFGNLFEALPEKHHLKAANGSGAAWCADFFENFLRR